MAEPVYFDPSDGGTTTEAPVAFCAHRSGIEYVQVTQPQGQQYEWWRCMVCHCEFRPTGEVRSGDGPGEGRISGVLAKRPGTLRG